MRYAALIDRFTGHNAKGNDQNATQVSNAKREYRYGDSEKSAQNYRGLLLAVMVLAVVGAVAMLPAFSHAEPPVDSWIYAPGHGWIRPPMGGPITKYVVDPDTGKTYLIEADYWGSAQISDADLNDVETGNRGHKGH